MTDETRLVIVDKERVIAQLVAINDNLTENTKVDLEVLKTLKRIEKMHKRNNSIGLWVTISIAIITFGMAYISIHAEVFEKEEVRILLNRFFDFIYSIVLLVS